MTAKKTDKFKDLIPVIREKTKACGLSLAELSRAIGMEPTHMSKFLGGGCGLGVEKLQKIGVMLNIDISEYAETPEALKVKIARLEKENSILKERLAAYGKISYIYENYEEFLRIKKFLEDNKDLIKIIKDCKVI